MKKLSSLPADYALDTASDSVPDYALAGGLVFDGDRFRPGYAVVVSEDRISGFISEEELPGRIERIDVEGNVIAPGFIDLQLNGCGGVLFNDAIAAKTLNIMHRTNLKSGCTSYLPTLITTSESDMLMAMRVVEAYHAEKGNAPVLGLHLEGPYINRKRKGIHNEAEIKSMSPSMRNAIVEFAGRIPLMLTLAPECVSEEDIRALAESGVVVSLGHSAATFEEARRGALAGAKSATHLFNAMSPWQGRDPGVVGAIFDMECLSCGVIVDGHHAHYASLRLAKKIKKDRFYLVTDATPPVGTGMTEFSFCGQTVYVRDGMCVNADGTLGGSYLTMIEAVGNGVIHAGWDLEETLRMASLYPARLMGVDATLGRIAPSYIANLAIFSFNTFKMAATVDQGRLHIWGEQDATRDMTSGDTGPDIQQ